MLRWIILAMSLGASITSIIHGVFMIFGSISMGAGPVGLNGIWLSALPIVSAISALIGGIVAFSGSRWGALFLCFATVLCAFATREIWIYGGLYFFAAILCFFIKNRDEPANYDYSYDNGDDADWDQPSGADNADDRIIDGPRPIRRAEEDVRPQKERRRTSKTCHNCGENVPVSFQFCPTCGASLHIPAGVEPEDPPEGYGRPPARTQDSGNTGALRTRVRSMAVSAPEPEDEFASGVDAVAGDVSAGGGFASGYMDGGGFAGETSGMDSGSGGDMDRADDDGGYDDMRNYEPEAPVAPKYRMLRPDDEPAGLPKRPGAQDVNPDESYREFGRYARRSKNPRRRSGARRLFNMLLLLGTVGGGLWFLLNLRKLPVGEIPAADRPPAPPAVAEKPADVLVQPVTPPPAPKPAKPQQRAGGLPSFTPGEPGHGSITGDSVRMRADHSTAGNSKVITRLSRNTRLDILGVWRGSSHPWYNVRTGSGQEGWVRGDYVQPLGSGLPSGYTNALLATFGDGRDAMTAKLGNPSKSSDTSLEWSGLSAKLANGKVTQIKLTGSKHELENKLKVGMAQTALYRIMGYPSSVSQRQLQYNEGGKNGVSVQLSRDGLIQSITVTEVK